MKKISILWVIILVMSLLIGCNSSKGVSTKQLITDISENTVLSNTLTSEFVPETMFKCIEHQVIKRQISENNTKDIIYTNIIGANDYIRAELSAILTYNYYDVGGWILDDVKIESKSLSPLQPANAEMVMASIKDITGNPYPNIYYWGAKDVLGEISPFVSNFNVLNSQLIDEEKETRINIQLTSCVSDIVGYVSLSFDDQNGWQWSKYDNGTAKTLPCIFISEDPVIDYQAILGTYSGNLPTAYWTYKLIDINETARTLTYSRGGERTYTEAIDLIAGHMGGGNGLAYNGGMYYDLYYNPNRNCLEHYYNDYTYRLIEQ